MQVAAGTYTGNGADDRAITDVGFQPDFVLIRGNDNNDAVIRTSAMVGDASSQNNSNGLVANLIQSLDSDGFTLGSAAAVNNNTTSYAWWAVADDGAVDFDVGTYTGNGVDDRSISVGFAPALVITMPTNANAWMWRTDQHSGDSSQVVVSGQDLAGRIQAFGATTFQVGTEAQVNTDAAVYYWVAFKNVAGFCSTVAVTGNGVDDRDITVTGITPALVFGGRSDTSCALFSNTDISPSTARMDGNAFQSNYIQALAAGSFQLGTDATVNGNGNSYRFFAVEAGSTAPVGVGGGGRAAGSRGYGYGYAQR